jgi:hypothetical protein
LDTFLEIFEVFWNQKLNCFEIFQFIHGLLQRLQNKNQTKIFMNRSQESLDKFEMVIHCSVLKPSTGTLLRRRVHFTCNSINISLIICHTYFSRHWNKSYYRFTPKITQWVLFEFVCKKSLSVWDLRHFKLEIRIVLTEFYSG